MNRGASLFLRAVVVLIGVGAVAFMLLEPRVEGRNVHASNFEIYFKDPFLAFAYIGSLPFFVGLFQAFKVLGFAGHEVEFSPEAVRSLRIIKHCAIVIIGFVVIGEGYIFLHESDDRAGGVAMGIGILFACVVVATAMTLLERALQSAVDLKSDRDLTI